jgi:hypothetical protein
MIETSAYYTLSDGHSELDAFKWSFCKHQKADREAWLAANPQVQSPIDTPVTNDGSPKIYASCPYCPTDVAFLRRERWSCVVRIWVDDGPEASPLHPCWESLMTASDSGFRSGFGRVRRLYGIGGPWDPDEHSVLLVVAANKARFLVYSYRSKVRSVEGGNARSNVDRYKWLMGRRSVLSYA